MNCIKMNEANAYSGDGYSGNDYPMTDPDINFATIKINCRSPKKGFQANTDCKELLYILNGSGKMYKMDSDEVYDFNKGDLLFIGKNEYYAFDGDFEAAVPCTPAWYPEQHIYTEE
jgi:hypothetical protein